MNVDDPGIKILSVLMCVYAPVWFDAKWQENATVWHWGLIPVFISFIIYMIVSFIMFPYDVIISKRFSFQPSSQNVSARKWMQILVHVVVFGYLLCLVPSGIILGNILYRNRDIGIGCEQYKYGPQMVMLSNFLIFFGMFEIVFFYTHRLAHHPAIYPKVHKRHHELKSTCAVGALYCSMCEMLFVNALSFAVGFVVTPFRVTLGTTICWFVLATINVLLSHAGRSIPFLKSSQKHDNHHKYFTCNYGVLGVMDAIHGTLRK